MFIMLGNRWWFLLFPSPGCSLRSVALHLRKGLSACSCAQVRDRGKERARTVPFLPMGTQGSVWHVEIQSRCCIKYEDVSHKFQWFTLTVGSVTADVIP